MRCPKCGSTAVRKVDNSLFLKPRTHDTFACFDCRHTWGEKPHKGMIVRWRRVYATPDGEGLGYSITGMTIGHPTIKGRILTSQVVKHDEQTGEVETQNSRYTLLFYEAPIRFDVIKGKD